MQKITIKPALRSILAVCASTLLIACNGTDSGFPQIADAPPFDLVDGEELRTNMHYLAFELQTLDRILMMGEVEDLADQDEIVTSLRNIERIADRLRDGDLTTRHRFLRDDMSTVLSIVRQARRGAEDNPPRYYMAGRVSGGCFSCHRNNS
ncbi:MAG: hypothetical protein RL839_09240 [Gammaproteobacteria bacterium]